MKKNSILLILLIYVNLINAQYTLTTEDGDTITNGSTYQVSVENINGLNEIKLILYSETSDDIIFQVTGSTQPDEAQNSFCVGMHCYAANDYTPKQEPLNNKTALLDLYYAPHGIIQDAKIDYHVHKYQDENVNFNFSVLFAFSTSVNNFEKNMVNIYPIPANRNVNIEFKDIFYGKIKIYDITGNKIFEKYYINNIVSINTTNLKDGMYFYNTSGNQNFKGKIIIKH